MQAVITPLLINQAATAQWINVLSKGCHLSQNGIDKITMPLADCQNPVVESEIAGSFLISLFLRS